MIRAIYTRLAVAAAAMAVGAAGAWYVQGQRLGLQIEQLKAAAADGKAKRSDAALKDERITAGKESAHAAKTQENSDEFTTSQPVRDAIARADRAVSDRLRLDHERRAATYRAQAQADATACRDLADRHEALDRHVVEGTGVVAGLRADLDRRDAEIVLLRRQVDIERTLLDGS